MHLENLPPGERAFHIHAKGVCAAPDFQSAGGHFNPAGNAGVCIARGVITR